MFNTALTRLAALTVPGIANYGTDALPVTISRAHLPALLVLPGSNQDNRLFKDYGAGFQATAFSGGAKSLTVTVTHLLLTAPLASGSGSRDHLPALIAHVDAYMTALAADVTLGGALAKPAQVVVEVGAQVYAGADYHGCAFRHTWALEIAGGGA